MEMLDKILRMRLRDNLSQSLHEIDLRNFCTRFFRYIRIFWDIDMFEKPIVMFDFETTGLSPGYGAQITEVAALRIVENKIVDRFVTLVSCNVAVPLFITNLTGITQRMVDSAPPVSMVVPQLLDFIGKDALSAHNASFDVKFLLAECHKLKLKPAHDRLICSLKLSRRMFPRLPSYKLSELSNSLGIRYTGSTHSAKADAEVSSKLLIHIGDHLSKTYGISKIEPTLLDRLNQLGASKVHDFLRKKF